MRQGTVIKLLLLLLPAMLFVSCDNNLKDIRKIYFSEFTPSGQAEDMNVKYTDSGRITAVLKSPKMLDYGTVSFPFTEFPKGVDVTLYDKKGKRTYITSDYAVSFKGTELIDLRNNVKIRSEDGQLLETEQLYFDQKNEWFFTEKNFKFTDSQNGSTTGKGIDFSKDFKRVNFQQVNGLINKSE